METKNWKWFKYNEVFTIKKGKRLTKADQINGNIPYISSKSTNNGIDGYIANGYTDENCISFACYGCIGEVFYHSGKVWVSDNCNAIYLRNRKLNADIAMFLISIFYKEKYKFSYGMTGKKERLKTFKIKLPINESELPDWQWVENYIKNIIPKLPQKAKSVWNNSFDKKAISDKKFSLNTENWKWIELKNIFKMERGVRLTKPNREKGNIPLITAGLENEGVAEYISNEEMKRYQNAITIDMFGNCFYREYAFCCDDNILVLSNANLNKYSGLFLSTIINFDEYKFAYGRQYRQKNFKQHKIKLPVNQQGNIDYQKMETYIKGLSYSKNI